MCFGGLVSSFQPVRDLRCLTALVVLTCVALAACGGAKPRNSAPSRSTVTAAFHGSPPALASLHAQADHLLGGGTSAFEARLRALRGHPVVVNKWASWCGPCQTEFPAFQQAAVKYGRQVAFLGVDGNDADHAASAFLRRFPVTYPSYVDPHSTIAQAIMASTYFPQTVYYNRQGQHIYDHAGPYTSARALESDIRHYLLQ
jgi:cytochrome c biogenesis protein CcmG, thiol:disulfide interchange protein DsbE